MTPLVTSNRSGPTTMHTTAFTDIPVPTSPVAQAAADALAHYSAPALVEHCRRSYLFAASLAQLEGLAIDHELLYVTAMLHDLGLEDPFDSHRLPFEEAGGHVAWIFAAGAGWSIERRERCLEIVIAHMRGADPAVDPEGYVLDLATGLDISGRHLERWPRDLISETLVAHPRLDLAVRFPVCVKDQAERKPDSLAGQIISAGGERRIRENPLDRWAEA